MWWSCPQDQLIICSGVLPSLLAKQWIINLFKYTYKPGVITSRDALPQQVLPPPTHAAPKGPHPSKSEQAQPFRAHLVALRSGHRCCIQEQPSAALKCSFSVGGGRQHCHPPSQHAPLVPQVHQCIHYPIVLLYGGSGLNFASGLSPSFFIVLITLCIPKGNWYHRILRWQTGSDYPTL